MTVDFDFKSDLQLDTGKGLLSLQNITVSAQQLELAGSINASGLNTSPSYQGELAINSLNPGALLPALGFALPSPTDSRVLKSLTGQLQFSGTDKTLQLPKINLQLDDSKLQGNVKISSFKNMASRFSLSIDSLDLDRYMPVNETQQSPDGQNSQSGISSSNEALLLPLAALRELNTNGRLRIGKLVTSGLQIDNLDAKIVAHNGFISLKSLTGNLYERHGQHRRTQQHAANQFQQTLHRH